jgi:tetratricopeptide (TPR) repeat protein
MVHLPENTASREALENSDLDPAERAADLADIRARWASQARPTTLSRWWRYAAAALIFAFAVWSIIAYQQTQRPVQLYAQHFQAAEDLDYLSLRSDESSTELTTMAEAIRHEQYREALALGRRLTEADPFSVQALLYQAIAAMELRDFPVAARALDQALALDMPAAERITARWYRALVHLGSNQPDAARRELEWVLHNSQGQRRSDAQALLTDLAR